MGELMQLQKIAGWSLLVPAFMVLIADLHRFAQPGRRSLISLDDALNSISRNITGGLHSVLPASIRENLLDPILTLPASLVLLSVALLILNHARKSESRRKREIAANRAERMFLN
ncbi:MAG: hypothetical protein Alpg2KO_12420 [Alphaproteobacteria bacterium]